MPRAQTRYDGAEIVCASRRLCRAGRPRASALRVRANFQADGCERRVLRVCGDARDAPVPRTSRVRLHAQVVRLFGDASRRERDAVLPQLPGLGALLKRAKRLQQRMLAPTAEEDRGDSSDSDNDMCYSG